MLPSIIFSGAYLIVPFPRSIVILIQTVPALLAKLLLPHLLSRVTYWVRTFAIALSLGISTFIIYVAPPNVPTWIRIIAVVLASVVSAAGDVSWLGLLRYYDKPGLAGWGIGTGAGAVVCALLPYWLTVHMGVFLRNGLGYAWYLVPMMLVAHSMILPQPPSVASLIIQLRSKGDDLDAEFEGSLSGLLRDGPQRPMSPRQRAKSNLILVRQLALPFILPLVLSSASQGVVYPGINRALAINAAFDNFTTFLAAYGFSFQVGNFVARCITLLIRPQRSQSLLMVLALLATLSLVNGIALLTHWVTVSFLLAFMVGAVSGAIYMETFAAALEENGFESGADREFSLGVISAGEPLGAIMGGLIAAAMESSLCCTSIGLGLGYRWCHLSR